MFTCNCPRTTNLARKGILYLAETSNVGSLSTNRDTTHKGGPDVTLDMERSAIGYYSAPVLPCSCANAKNPSPNFSGPRSIASAITNLPPDFRAMIMEEGDATRSPRWRRLDRCLAMTMGGVSTGKQWALYITEQAGRGGPVAIAMVDRR
ncbi:hypothetical protein JAAARDRAFT_40459 [Jaapia argillacea MUCL 33604]|uniref:Uncharacterized protein n=1 Tax=Jaapia argillacea MUCL 33604 TaxID=933084 RepID=A0A067PAX4_9AGAM|nr:hypothetical protein JAAARDRAFT_40459 [Jaapia argillacea MUCL 33604]